MKIQKERNVEIVCTGSAVGKNIIYFDSSSEKIVAEKLQSNRNIYTRYRISEGEDQITLAIEAIEDAFRKTSKLSIEDIDCIVVASAVGYQPLPTTSAKILEELSKKYKLKRAVSTKDINTSCTSFLDAFDDAAMSINFGKYENVLIVSSELASLGLSTDNMHSFSMFSDGAAAIVVTKSEEYCIGFHYARTWPGTYDLTKIEGGLTKYLPSKFDGTNHEKYRFQMEGNKLIKLIKKEFVPMIKEILELEKLDINDIDYVIPHQASKALKLFMRNLGIKKDQFCDIFEDYGNMVAASIPFTLNHAYESNYLKGKDTVLLIGTSAGTSGHILLYKKSIRYR
ncbi:3-oxoacyl-[acyl-carrier-protein] synthase III C-terminal domain-containing protein [Wukongibacter baidiensis]|uniref:3-oxoacyl-ACP synthase III family protein n=1 Tax=Wukongibacter baidiensis TaxID=1723361 RepID=UPI003D7FA911